MAHLTFKISLIAGLLLSLTAQAAHCQAYNYRSGNARVVSGAGGLANPSGSYITGGTLSRSAQAGAGLSTYSNLQNGASTSGVSGAGLTPGISGNSNLTVARMGSTVGMPGDYMRSDLNPNFSYQHPRQNVQYRNQRRGYQQQQQQTNQVATYGKSYEHYGSNPTGRQATQVATPSAGQSSTSTATSKGSGASNGEFKGY